MSRADYYDRRAARLSRLDGRARTLSTEASGLWQRASAMADRIPLGQPILVGHHSERRDRGYRARIRRAFERAHETSQAAESAARRAAHPSRAISSDAPDAIALLRAKVAKLTSERDRAKAINRAVRLKDASKGDAAMRALGLSDAAIASMREPDFAGRLGVPDYRLTNIGAEVRRAEARIAELEREASRAAAPPADLEVAPGITVSENVDANRIQIVFPGKPDDATRAALKREGFRWSPREGAWQRLLNDAGRAAVKRVTTILALRLLVAENDRGGSPSFREIAAHLGIRSTNAVSDLMIGLEARGLIEPRPIGAMRRARVTAAGRAALWTAAPEIDKPEPHRRPSILELARDAYAAGYRQAHADGPFDPGWPMPSDDAIRTWFARWLASRTDLDG